MAIWPTDSSMLNPYHQVPSVDTSSMGVRQHTQRHRWPWRLLSASGWRATGYGLTGLLAILIITLISCLLASISKLPQGSAPLQESTVVYEGNCDVSTRNNLLLHFAINAVASGILASSNFFMQVLVAPTREEVDRAHANHTWLEIGVQSFRNIFHVPKRNVLFWLLLSVSTIPLHLFFNGAVLESRASTEFILVMASDGFLRGEPWSIPGVAMPVGRHTGGDWGRDMSDVVEAISKAAGGEAQTNLDPTWDRVSLEECVDIYNQSTKALTLHRHVVMIIGDEDGSRVSTWTTEDVFIDPDGDGFVSGDSAGPNSLWIVEQFARTDKQLEEVGSFRGTNSWKFTMNLDPSTGILRNDPKVFNSKFTTMKAQYCLSERFEVPCRIEVDNALLLIVCVIASIKLVICVVILIVHRHRQPFVTPGDAIESFISKPDENTRGACTLDSKDVGKVELQRVRASPGKEWKAQPNRFSKSVPVGIWIWSYLLICASLTVALYFLVQTGRNYG